MSLDDILAPALQARRQLNLYRKRRTLQSPQGRQVTVDGHNLLNFCSNDYLGLANHPYVIESMAKAIEQYGVGGGASHLVCGHSAEHHALEEALAEFTGRDRALLFSTGYMANLGIIQALLGKSDAVFEDKLNHASLIDGGLLSRAAFHRYPHVNMSALEKKLSSSDAARKLIVTDGVFSMDGDIAPLTELADLAEKYKAWLMVDDAHGFASLGKCGGGVQETHALNQQRLPILMGTLGKGIGSFGAFVAGSETLIETLIQFARPYIYTTSMPPAVAAATRASLHLVQSEGWRRDQLAERIHYFKRSCEALNISLMPSTTAIQPLIIGQADDALWLSEYLLEKGVWVSAIRPPTVAKGTARLRITLTAEHTHSDINQLVDALNLGLNVLREKGTC